MKDYNKINGITLISLVITIVIMLILATVSINLIIGNNGLFSKTKQSASAYKLANAEEKVSLAVSASYDDQTNLNSDELKDNINKIDGLKTKVDTITYDLKINVDGFDFIINEAGNVTSLGKNNNLPENSFDHPQDMGKEVALKDEWSADTVTYVKTLNGVEVTNVTKVATVYAVAAGVGETVPIPQKFYYVGGNFDTGVIISDNIDDKYDGNTDKTSYEYTRQLKGNQFVFIPCDESMYKQTDWDRNDSMWDKKIHKAEIVQIQKYGGFYVARYEAGLASTIPESKTVQCNNGSNQIYNVDGIPQSKAGLAPWNFINWTHAYNNANSMYNNNYVSSGLITGTQWDVILNVLKSKENLTDTEINSIAEWGNFKDDAIDYTGRLARYYYTDAYYLDPFGDEETGTTTIETASKSVGTLLTTGACKNAEKYHIFDFAGNVFEWTEEDSRHSTSGDYSMQRGGGFNWNSSTYGTSYRGYDDIIRTNVNVGFRTVLYMK